MYVDQLFNVLNACEYPTNCLFFLRACIALLAIDPFGWVL